MDTQICFKNVTITPMLRFLHNGRLPAMMKLCNHATIGIFDGYLSADHHAVRFMGRVRQTHVFPTGTFSRIEIGKIRALSSAAIKRHQLDFTLLA